MQPILVSYHMELVHLDFLTLGGEQMTKGVLISSLSYMFVGRDAWEYMCVCMDMNMHRTYINGYI